jgi:hypothetical protein
MSSLLTQTQVTTVWETVYYQPRATDVKRQVRVERPRNC